ncbi:MAG TPA: hypothetical protein VK198_18250 [Terriglobales bacterium]|nr:hypothetical protein [Terriglobales bacterium]
MARMKGEAYQVGSLVGFKLTREDLADIIPFLNERKAAGDEISGLLRGIVREHVRKQTNPGPPHVDPDQLASWVGQLIRRAMTGEGELQPLTQAEARAVIQVAAEIDAHADAVGVVKAKLGSKFADDDD